MQLTVFTDYSLRTLMFLAERRDRISSVREIALHYGISYNHLVKVVHKLAQSGYIESTKGKGGGIRLAVGAEKNRLGDIVRALEPNMNIVECFNQDANTCRVSESCQLKHYLFAAKQAFVESLNRYTLADTCKNPTISKMLEEA